MTAPIAVAVTVVAMLVGLSMTPADARARAAPMLDIEFAFDSTGTMGPLIAQAQKDAQSIIESVLAFEPGARFSVVAFRDVGYPAAEYEVLQRFTSSRSSVTAAMAKLRAVPNPGPGNTSAEAYNVVFDKSVTDSALGWRPNSRKVVVVFGDAEPHGAGSLGLLGCRDATTDPHGLNTVDTLARMRATGRVLLLVRQEGNDATLGCYRSIASRAASGGAALNAGGADIGEPIRKLLDGTLAVLEVSRGFPLALPGTNKAISITIRNNSRDLATLESTSLRLPAGAAFRSARGQLGPATTSVGKVSWVSPRRIGSGRLVSEVASLTMGAPGVRVVRASARVTLADGNSVPVAAATTVRVGRSFNARLVGLNPRNPVGGGATLTYSGRAKSLLAAVAAKGTFRIGSVANGVTVRAASARVTSASSDMVARIRGTVSSSGRPSCRVGSTVTLIVVDHDAVRARTTPDVARLVGSGCALRAPVDVVTR